MFQDFADGGLRDLQLNFWYKVESKLDDELMVRLARLCENVVQFYFTWMGGLPTEVNDQFLTWALSIIQNSSQLRYVRLSGNEFTSEQSI